MKELKERDPDAPLPELIWTPDVTRSCSKRAFDGLVSQGQQKGMIRATLLDRVTVHTRAAKICSACQQRANAFQALLQHTGSVAPVTSATM